MFTAYGENGGLRDADMLEGSVFGRDRMHAGTGRAVMAVALLRPVIVRRETCEHRATMKKVVWVFGVVRSHADDRRMRDDVDAACNVNVNVNNLVASIRMYMAFAGM